MGFWVAVFFRRKILAFNLFQRPIHSYCMNLLQKLLYNLPLPISGLMLAIASLGILFPQFFQVFSRPEAGFVLHVLCGVFAAVLWILLVLKAVFFFPQIKAAGKNPVLASVAGTFPMTIMALAVYVFELFGEGAVLFWYAGVILHAALIGYFSLRFLKHPRLSEVYPSWLVVYVGIVLAAITAPYFNQIAVGQLCFWFGAAALVPLLPALLVRCTQMPLADSVKPLFCIFAAPISILLAGYVQSFSADTALVFTLLAAETVILVLVLQKLPGLLRLPFCPGYSAFTFPFVVTATAYLLGIETLVEAGVLGTGWYAVSAAVLLLAAVLVVYVSLRYAQALRKMVFS